VQARRETYYACRRKGMGMWESGFAAGLDEQATIKRYERWWKKIGSKEEQP